MLKSVALRFLRAFVAGGLANAVSLTVASHSVSSLKEMEVWIYSLAVGFVTGGLMAIDKLLRSKTPDA